MQFKSHPARRAALTFFLVNLLVWISPDIFAQSNLTVRIMAANLNGNTQSYQPFALRILQGTKPDVVCIQEFNYASTNGVDVNTPVAMREMVDTAFGTNFVYYREPFSGNGDIPNGVISRYPIVASGSWADTVQSQPNRGFCWAQIDLPGTNDLYVVSVHLLTSSSANRAAEAANLKTLMQANFPANAWIVVAGDFNAGSRTEACVTTFNGYLTDFPVPVDNTGDSDTSANRNSPHDYVLPSLTFTNVETATVFPTLTYPNGLVFDSRVYNATDLAVNFSPVQFADSGNAQHMAVMKDFLIPVSGTTMTSAPTISSQPQSQTVSPAGTATFSVSAAGTAPLAYQWLFNGSNISSATTNPFTFNNAQMANAGNYSVIVTNLYGSITSSIAILTISNTPPTITTQPQSQSVNVGASPTFTVIASGTTPLNYQWLFGGTNIPGANANSYTRSNVQANDAGNYSVVITNLAGSATSAVATLTVMPVIVTTNQMIIAQWNFNSPTADTNVGTGTIIPSIGTGTASLIGGATASFATGDTTFDPAGSTDNSGWNTTTYPAQGSANKTRGVQFAVSTAGKQSLVVSWSSQASNTGSEYGRLQYTTNGTDFMDFPAAFTNGISFTVKTNSLAVISGVNDNPNFAVRLVAEFESTAAGTANANYVAAGTTYGTSGTMRYDMVTISGTPIITNFPPAAAVLSTSSFNAGQFQMVVNGSSGSNYVVQVSTNLATSGWVSIFTNASPFTFTDTNFIAPQKFYRAISQP